MTHNQTLTNPWRSSSDNRFRTRNVHDLEEEPGAKKNNCETVSLGRDEAFDIQVLDNPLHDTQIVHHLHKRNEKDNGRQL